MTSEYLLQHLSPHLLDRGPEAGWTMHNDLPGETNDWDS